ncbi:MAG: dihydropteroate synthase [Planctomycetes bacterium]|nr:dihydropteroate synthase [Planctomycetota bacterium]
MAAAILGILNITSDSYSDGGQFLDPARALEHGLRLARDGAAMVDIGAQSSHPDAADVAIETQIERLTPVVAGLVSHGVRVSIDTHQPEVAHAMLKLGAQAVNDITAARDARLLALLARSSCSVILMHSTSSAARAERSASSQADWIARLLAFFEERIAACERAGVARSRLLLDPGMGFFLSRDPRPSFEVLRRVGELRGLGLPLCVGVSRKSFLGARPARDVGERGPSTLAAELWCAEQGVEWIRTHDVRALADALATRASIRGEA